MGPFAAERGVRPVVIPELQRDPRLLDDLRAFVKICRIVFSTRPDIIHTHTAKAGALGRMAGFLYNLHARLAGRPRAVICHTFHGHLFHGYFPRWISAVLIVGERMLACVTDRIITVSEQLKQELTRVYRICPQEKCSVVPVGLDFQWTRKLPETRGTFRNAAGVPSDSLAVGIIGRLTAIKNHELFLRAASDCRVPGARFFVIGDGERQNALRELSDRLGLNGRVVFTGWQHDLAKIYSDLDIACLTSLNEGTPVALIEAMAAGVPVVATKVGGVSDLMVGSGSRTPDGFEVFSNGILVPPDRPDLFGAALEFLATRPDLRRAMGVSGRSFVRERFSIERLVSQVESLYLDLLTRESS
jgi:glycosyltransferase involved in cell wall biosynthesis